MCFIDPNSTNTTEKPPKVSIGMPVYNGEPYIREALDSLLAQTFTDFELIISDNASTDNTESICREYAAKDPRIRYIRQPENRGAIANFKFVLDQARGEYFMWAAHDDRWDSMFIELTSHTLDNDLNVGLAFSDFITKNLITGAIKSYSSCGFTTSKNKIIRYLFRLVHGCSNLIYGLFRREVLLNVPLYQFDYYDIYLTHWFELESGIKTVPLPLFTAGEKGTRIPYSVTNTKIDYNSFLKAEYELLKKHFKFPLYLIMQFAAWYVVRRNTNVLNKMISKGNVI